MINQTLPRKPKSFLQRWYPGVNTRVTAPFLAVVIVIAGIAIFVITRLVAGTIEERLGNQLADSAQAVTNTMVEVERQYLATLRLMVFTEGVADAISNNDVASLDRLLSSVAANENVDELLIFNNDGENIFRLSLDDNRLLDVSTWQSVINVRNGFSDADGDKFIELQAVDDSTLIFFTGGVDTDDGERVGGVALGITTRHLLRILNEQALSAVTLNDGQGNVVDSTFRSGIRETLAIEPEQVTDYLGVIDTDAAPVSEFVIDGTPYQFLYAPFELRGERVGVLAVSLPVGFVNDRISTSRNAFVLLFGVLFVTVGGLGVVVSRSIIRPVFRMVETTRAIRDGDLSQRVNLRMPDEFGELSSSFDHMTGELIKRNQEINALYIDQIEETARREAMLTSISDAVIVLDIHGDPILTNETAHRLINSVRNDREAHRRFINITSNPEKMNRPRSLNLAHQHFSVLATPVRMKDGDLLGHVVVFRDITDIVKAEKLKDEMILQLSHELRTPLTTARGYVELVQMLGGASLNEQHNDFLHKTVDELSVLGDMINQVVDVSSILAGRFEIELENTDIILILRDVINEHHHRIESSELELITSLPDDEFIVRADPTRLRDAIGHVLKNAYSYTLAGGSIRIDVDMPNNTHIRVTIEDTGVGIDASEQTKVFERMYRGRSADAGATDTRGLGLGLYFFKQIIEAHGGIINLESEINAGTRVSLQLPLLKAIRHDDETIPRRTSVNSGETIQQK